MTAQMRRRLAGIEAPAGYWISLAGTVVDMALGQAEMGRALNIGSARLQALLVTMFRSFLHPFTVMAAITLAVASGFWGLLLFDEPMCKPAK